jgi:hypothetical protein
VWVWSYQLISSTPHASKVFIMLIITFDKTPNRPRITTKISIQILNQIEPMDKASIIHVEKVINQLVAKEKVNIES